MLQFLIELLELDIAEAPIMVVEAIYLIVNRWGRRLDSVRIGKLKGIGNCPLNYAFEFVEV